jgi:hypothetical protein
MAIKFTNYTLVCNVKLENLLICVLNIQYFNLLIL